MNVALSIRDSAGASNSASSRMMAGSLPPSSSVTPLMVWAAFAMMCLADGMLPVKPILPTSRCVVRCIADLGGQAGNYVDHARRQLLGEHPDGPGQRERSYDRE